MDPIQYDAGPDHLGGGGIPITLSGRPGAVGPSYPGFPEFDCGRCSANSAMDHTDG
jgi:hypothetical protein